MARIDASGNIVSDAHEGEQGSFKDWVLATPRAQQLLTASWSQVEAAIENAVDTNDAADLKILFKMSAGHARIYARREGVI